MRTTFLFLLTIAAFIWNFTASAQKRNIPADGKILIVYLSMSQDSRTVAQMIQQKLGGDTLGIHRKISYPEDYAAFSKQIRAENLVKAKPELSPQKLSIKNYHTIFIGFPSWQQTLPAPMRTFLSINDWSGKNVIPFNTNIGWGSGNCFEIIKTTCIGAKVLPGLEINWTVEPDPPYLAVKQDRVTRADLAVLRWLKQLGMVED